MKLKNAVEADVSVTDTDSGTEFAGNVSGSYKIFIRDRNMSPITEAVI